MPILGRFQMLVCYFLLAVRLGFLSVINWYTGNPLAILRQTYQTSDLGSEMRGITLFGAQTISTQYQGMSSSTKQQKNNINVHKFKMAIANSNKKISLEETQIQYQTNLASFMPKIHQGSFQVVRFTLSKKISSKLNMSF